MKNKPLASATAQGVVTFDKNGNRVVPAYEKTFQAKSHYKPHHIAQMHANMEKIHLNHAQRAMYRRLMYGLKEYAPEEIAALSPSAISKIVTDYKRAKRVLHVMKAKKYYQAENKLLNSIFTTKTGDKDYDWYLELPKTATLRSLGISTKEVIDEFIRRRLLPRHFFSINPENVSL